mmetsp:Transcript_45872/g.70154  ORF Transcript_45872/g.70154 Transcript_45872/m.70154 type:complete len:146 (+) Transcript_45872:2-439(+)
MSSQNRHNDNRQAKLITSSTHKNKHTMSPFSSFSDMATRSTIYKRHENRSNAHSGSQAGRPLHPPHQPIDHSVGETLANLTRRSTIFHTHDVHHAEMKHNQHAGERFMIPSMANHHDGVIDAIVHMPSESSIYDRNSRRNQFLHA